MVGRSLVSQSEASYKYKSKSFGFCSYRISWSTNHIAFSSRSCREKLLGQGEWRGWTELLRRFKDQDLELPLPQNLPPPRAALEKALRVWVASTGFCRGRAGERGLVTQRPIASVDRGKPGKLLRGCPEGSSHACLVLTVEAGLSACQPEDPARRTPRGGGGPPTVLLAHRSSPISCGSWSPKRTPGIFASWHACPMWSLPAPNLG